MTPLYSANAAERFARHVKAAPNGCLEWQGALADGYGRFWRGVDRNATKARAHRAAWELAKGPIPEEMFVCHRCDNRRCVNVDHLFLGTHADNMRDMFDKGRDSTPPYWQGERHPSARLTDRQVARLRELAPKINNWCELGRLFGVSHQHARRLALRQSRS